MGRFDKDEERLEKENSLIDATMETFYDDYDIRKENEGVCIISYMSDELGKCYSIQIPNCNIWMTEEVFKRVGIGVEKAMNKIRENNKINGA